MLTSNMIIKGIRITVYCFVTYNCFNLFGEETHSCIILVGLLKKTCGKKQFTTSVSKLRSFYKSAWIFPYKVTSESHFLPLKLLSKFCHFSSLIFSGLLVFFSCTVTFLSERLHEHQNYIMSSVFGKISPPSLIFVIRTMIFISPFRS